MSRLTRDGTAESVSRDQFLRHARGQGNIHFPCSADHEQDWQPYPVDPYSAPYLFSVSFLSVVFAFLLLFCTHHSALIGPIDVPPSLPVQQITYNRSIELLFKEKIRVVV